MRARSAVGADVVRRWSDLLPSGSAILDVGCGSGVPISEVLISRGFEVFGVDASPTLVAAFSKRFTSDSAGFQLSARRLGWLSVVGGLGICLAALLVDLTQAPAAWLALAMTILLAFTLVIALPRLMKRANPGE